MKIKTSKGLESIGSFMKRNNKKLIKKALVIRADLIRTEKERGITNN